MKSWPPYAYPSTTGKHQNAAPTLNRRGSWPDALGYQQMIDELCAVVEGAGLDLDENDSGQLLEAILALIESHTTSVPGRALVHYGVDTGVANAYSVAATPVVGAYDAGTTVVFIALHDNTGEATFRARDSLPPLALKRADGTALQANDVQAGRLQIAVCTGDDFRLVGAHGGFPVVAVQDIGTANAMTGAGNPTLPAWRAGQLVLLTKGPQPNTAGAVTLNVDGRGAKSVVKQAGGALASGDLAASGMVLLGYDGTRLNLVGLAASDVAAGQMSIVSNNLIVGGRITQYATPGTVTKTIPAGTPFEIEQCRGAGGGGGGSASTAAAASGGGGGGVARGIYLAVNAVTLTITVGAGGPGGAAGGATNGTAGGTTSVVVTTGTVQRANGTTVTAGGTLCSAIGGGGGFGSASGPQTTDFGAGGTATGGDVNDVGAAGGFAYATGAAYVGGLGGSSPVGGGATPGPNVGFGGIAGNSPGGGGNGSSANGAGGAGAPGRVVIRS